MAQNQNSRFLLGLANSIIGGVKSRQDEEKALADQLMGLIMKAQIESAMKSQLQQSGMENLRELSGNSDYDIGYKMDDEGSILPTASPVNADDLFKRAVGQRKLAEMSQGSTVADIQSRTTPVNYGGDLTVDNVLSGKGSVAREDTEPSQYITDYEFKYDPDTGVTKKVPVRRENKAYDTTVKDIKSKGRADKYSVDALKEVNDLLSDPNIDDVFGRLTTKWSPRMPGGNRARVESKMERLKSLLVLPNMEVFRGLGPMSDRDIAQIQASVAALNTDLSPADARTELNRIKDSLTNLNNLVKGQSGGEIEASKVGKLKNGLTYTVGE